MAGFVFKLETPEGAPAEPPTLRSAVPNWQAGDSIPLGRRTLRVVRVRDDDAHEPPLLAVEEDGTSWLVRGNDVYCGAVRRSPGSGLQRAGQRAPR